jgi:Fic family protein
VTWKLAPLPPSCEIETREVLRKVASAHRYLAELKGVSRSIPNQAVLINSLSLQEAKDSSAVENIVTTHDELYRDSLFPDLPDSAAAKEVSRYAAALKEGYELVRANGLLTCNHVLAVQAAVEGNPAGFRRQPGAELRNDQTGDTIYVPPQHPDEVRALMANLELYINDDEVGPTDPLVRMAVIHYQFESIHPFYDGNGRTGRILNVLYLVRSGLLDIPVLYLSRRIIRTKTEYYRALQDVRDHGAWQAWVLYMLDVVEETARHTIRLVTRIDAAMTDYKRRIRSEQSRLYSHDLIACLFMHPYTSIAFIQRDLGVGRATAAKYLDTLTEGGFLAKHRVGAFQLLCQSGALRHPGAPGARGACTMRDAVANPTGACGGG